MASPAKLNHDQLLMERKLSARVLTLNRPKQLNALSYYMVSKLLEIFHDDGGNSGVKLVVLKKLQITMESRIFDMLETEGINWRIDYAANKITYLGRYIETILDVYGEVRYKEVRSEFLEFNIPDQTIWSRPTPTGLQPVTSESSVGAYDPRYAYHLSSPSSSSGPSSPMPRGGGRALRIRARARRGGHIGGAPRGGAGRGGRGPPSNGSSVGN